MESVTTAVICDNLIILPLLENSNVQVSIRRESWETEMFSHEFLNVAIPDVRYVIIIIIIIA